MTGTPGEDRLEPLTRLCSEGLAFLPESFLARNAEFLQRSQSADGGFPGPDGESDLYYTSFALRAAGLLGIDGQLWPRAAGYLRDCVARVGDVVDCHCLLHAFHLCSSYGHPVRDVSDAACTGEQVLAVLEGRRATGSGFSKQPGGGASVYHTFLASLCYAMLSRPMAGAESAVELVRSRQRADGGFADLAPDAPASGSGVNATAAAVQLLAMHDSLDAATASRAASFVVSAGHPQGGFAAYPDCPVPDAMSTFTGLVTLWTTGSLDRMRLGLAARFIRRLRCDDGGFRGTEFDQRPDLEYTYYTLGALGILGGHGAAAHARQSRVSGEV